MSAPRRFTVVGFGEVLWDRLPGGRQLGGAPANFVYHARLQGDDAVLVSAVGDDEAGRDLRRRLAELEIPTAHVPRVEEAPTGAVDVEVGTGGAPTYTIHQPAAWDRIPERPELYELANRCDAICYGTLSQRGGQNRALLHRVLDATSPNALRVFDINLRQEFYSHLAIADSLERTNVLKLNDEELPVVREMLHLRGEEEACCRALLERYGLRLVALTRGAAGSVLVTAEETHRLDGARVRVKDTVGAGDAFTAALTAGLLRGRPLGEIHEHAARLAAHVCAQAGATPAIPPALRLGGG